MSLLNRGNAMMLSLLTFLALTGCQAANIEDPTADNNVTAEEIAEQPNAVKGETVTIRSQVVQKVDDSSFTVSDEQFSADDAILVVNTSGKPFLLPEDEDLEVQATGEITTFTLTELEQEYDLDLESDTYVEYETKPALLANSLALAPDPGEVTENPGRFYNLNIAVEGEVEEVFDSNTLTLDEEQLFGASDLLVVGVPVPEGLDGQRVTVTGTLRPFILSEFEKDYDLTWDLDIKEKIEAEYSSQPVFIADAIYPIP